MVTGLKNKLLHIAVFYFAVAPLLTFIHELGHAIIPLLKGEQVIIRVGGYVGSSFSLGVLSIAYSPWMPWLGHTDWSGETEIMRLALGPMTSLAIAVLIFFLIRKKKRPTYGLLFMVSLCWVIAAFLVTAYPVAYPSFLINSPEGVSDGKQILDILMSGN